MTRDRLVTFWKSQKGNKKIMRNISLGKWHFYSLDSSISISPKGSEPLTLEQSSLSQLDAQARPLILWCCRFLVKGFFFFFANYQILRDHSMPSGWSVPPGSAPGYLVNEEGGHPLVLSALLFAHMIAYTALCLFNIPFIGTGLYCKHPSVRF